MNSINTRAAYTILPLLLFAILTLSASAEVSQDALNAGKQSFGVFTNPERVTIEGYSQDAMEPFISPDGSIFSSTTRTACPR